MIVYIIILIIYASFTLDFFFWPVKSEASAGQLIMNWGKFTLKNNLVFLSVFLINSVFCLSPLFISFYFLGMQIQEVITPMDITGILLAFLGRTISIRGAQILNNSPKDRLITGSLYKWSRNPISFGLYITFLGFVLIIYSKYLFAGWLFFILGMDLKIGIEEKYLMEKYGNRYLQYKSRTPKYCLI